MMYDDVYISTRFYMMRSHLVEISMGRGDISVLPFNYIIILENLQDFYKTLCGEILKNSPCDLTKIAPHDTLAKLA